MPGRRLVFAFLILLCAGAASAERDASAQPLRLILPTSNDALLHDDGPAFYMYTDRYYKGRRSQPWEGGQYGYVRNMKETPHGTVFTRFHEGVDIRPLYRDAAGEPLDTVRTIDEGRVVYVNHVESHSNYGKYVVVEHWWSGAPFYSLYAHLSHVYVREGQEVVQGQRLARMGHTGRGIDRRRAHVHFEINMMLNANYPGWHRASSRGGNRHDAFNGYNLAGLDVAALYLAMRDDPGLTIEKFFARQEPFFKVAVPGDRPIDLLYRYPFLARSARTRVSSTAGVAAWEISFTPSGLPVRIEPSDRRVFEPTVTMVQHSPVPYSYLTSGTLTGSGRSYTLTSSGHRYLDLLLAPVERDDYWDTVAAAVAGPAPVARKVSLQGPQPVEVARTPVDRLTAEEAARREEQLRAARGETGKRRRGW